MQTQAGKKTKSVTVNDKKTKAKAGTSKARQSGYMSCVERQKG